MSAIFHYRILTNINSVFKLCVVVVGKWTCRESTLYKDLDFILFVPDFYCLLFTEDGYRFTSLGIVFDHR